ncbi:hypothetical protein KOR42_10420 [Thalassoglobus neptunius]|uniref:Uncharacterized protein n=1 Tax=Thalassoglobus neptunius TaxID=1938619 RepID=A0A5C5X4M7_9PLAN|nr:hypothetical protein KOR42_10420 [Thalassoglobus neptunius]
MAPTDSVARGGNGIGASFGFLQDWIPSRIAVGAIQNLLTAMELLCDFSLESTQFSLAAFVDLQNESRQIQELLSVSE